jgi:hypothetical protein
VRAQRLAVEADHEVRRRAHAGEALEGQRAELPALGDGVGGGAQLVGLEPREQPLARPEDADVRAEPLVGRARQRVSAERRDVERAVRRGVHGVEEDARAGRVGGGDDAREVGDGADRVARGGHGHPPRALREHDLDGRGRQLERAGLGLGVADRRARALGGEPPRLDVGVVVQARDDELVAGLQRAPGGGREAHRERGHRRSEDDAAGVGAEEAADGRARLVDELVGGQGRGEGPAVVGRAPERIHAAIASMASSTICVPAGASRRAQPSDRPGKRSRSTAVSTAPRRAAGARRARADARRRGRRGRRR